MTLPTSSYKIVDPTIVEIVSEYGGDPNSVLDVLREVQTKFGSLTPHLILEVSRVLDIPAERVYGVATFYSMLTLTEQPPSAPAQVMRICDGPVCWLKSAQDIQTRMAEQLGDGWEVDRSSCLGLCDRAPAGLLGDQQVGPLSSQSISQGQIIAAGKPVDYSTPLPGELRVMLAHAGEIDPDSLESAISYGVYQALIKALTYRPEEVVAQVESSGLTGRGGAGFPVGRKWRFVNQADGSPKYVICNADESEPLIFKDRVLIDTNPHQILEGMAIAGYATGSEEAFIYIRGEYEYQARRLEHAISQAESTGWLGKNIQGSNFSFHVHLHRGAGAYICGEETALIESLEGKRGEPRFRPPYPPSYGYMGKPTLVNNVESFASVPAILRNGWEWYRSLSTSTTPGTKLYMILGAVNRPGLFEAPFGITLREAIEEFGGGVIHGSQFHFALTGGAAGTLVPETLIDIPIDYSSASKGISLGAGAMLICDHTVPVVEFLRVLLFFFTMESCGKCTPCRVGTRQSLEILNRLSSGKGRSNDLQQLQELAEVMGQASFCGLGQSVAVPLGSAMTYFLPEMQAAVRSN